jgi:hypothetical protein
MLSSFLCHLQQTILCCQARNSKSAGSAQTKPANRAERRREERQAAKALAKDTKASGAAAKPYNRSSLGSRPSAGTAAAVPLSSQISAAKGLPEQLRCALEQCCPAPQLMSVLTSLECSLESQVRSMRWC